jgi:hypothetical protein
MLMLVSVLLAIYVRRLSDSCKKKENPLFSVFLNNFQFFCVVCVSIFLLAVPLHRVLCCEMSHEKTWLIISLVRRPFATRKIIHNT